MKFPFHRDIQTPQPANSRQASFMRPDSRVMNSMVDPRIQSQVGSNMYPDMRGRLHNLAESPFDPRFQGRADMMNRLNNHASPQYGQMATPFMPVPYVAKPQAGAPVSKPQAGTPVSKPQAGALVSKPQAGAPVSKPQVVKPVAKPQAVARVSKPQAVARVSKPQAVAPVSKPQAVAPAPSSMKVVPLNMDNVRIVQGPQLIVPSHVTNLVRKQPKRMPIITPMRMAVSTSTPVRVLTRQVNVTM